jgi:hypothetical protein
MIAIGAVALVVLVAIVIGGLVLLRPYLSGEHPASLSTPSQVAGLEISDDPLLADAAVQLSALLTSEAELDDAVAAFYSDPGGGDRLVLLAGGTAALRDPAGELDAAFGAAGAGGLPVTGVSPVDPGPLGGTARCGEAVAEGVTVAVCGWADHGSLALMVFFSRSVDESAGLLRDVRAEVLSR